MASGKRRRITYQRGILQWAILGLLVYMLVRPFFDKSYFADFEAYCPFGGMQSLMSYFNAHSLACSMTTVQIALGLALLIGVVFFAKLFCSYICPIGTVTEWLGKLGRKLKVQLTLHGLIDKALRLMKYALLFITVYFTVTSSELFCRTFDPYFALVSGFGSDVFIWYAIPALLLTIVGSFFIRQFWCKYLCPLGAITNLAVYALPVAALALIWVIINRIFGGVIHWTWFLGAVCLLGFLLESTTLRFLVFPPLRIVRNQDICTSCRICDKKCPMALNISTVSSVQHIDCHLCTDCIVKCPESGALTINKRWPKWLPVLITLVLIGLALLISGKYEIPTISEQWGGDSQMQVASVFEMDGLKNIKCFGSSRAFANHMKEVQGVLGVETFVKHHRVKVLYDKSIISESGVKEAIFSPVSEFFELPDSSKKSVSVVSIGVDHCFDPNDQYYLTELLYRQKGVLALQTHFGEPVEAKIYYDESLVSLERINKAIEQKQLVTGEGNGRVTQELDFAVKAGKNQSETVSVSDFLKQFFEETDITFNFYETYIPDQLQEWQVSFPQAADPALQEWIPYLISHSSNDDGIVRFSIIFSDGGPMLKLVYVKTMTSPEKIFELLKQPKMQVHFPDGKTEEAENPFSF
jgi:ferredoxin/uncharacterized membrane protein